MSLGNALLSVLLLYCATRAGKLIIARQKLARVLGFDSFAHKSLSRKVIKTPQQVQDLLLETARCVAHQADTEADLLRSVKASLLEAAEDAGGHAVQKKVNNRIYASTRAGSKNKSSEELDCVALFPWDEGYLINSYKSITSSNRARDAAASSATGNSGPSASVEAGAELAEFLSVPSCMNGLRFVCAKVFGIVMRAEEVSPEEEWTAGGQSGDLLKCSFTGPQGEPLGFIYFDLYARKNKFSGAAHFTIRCGCTNTYAPGSGSGSGSGEQQLPVVALVMNFPRGALLSMQALETFYHESGHALHSLLSRTKFQHLSGTRGSTDFAEVSERGRSVC